MLNMNNFKYYHYHLSNNHCDNTKDLATYNIPLTYVYINNRSKTEHTRPADCVPTYNCRCSALTSVAKYEYIFIEVLKHLLLSNYFSWAFQSILQYSQ